MKLVKTRKCEVKYDQYRDGIWWKSTGREALFTDGVWWGEYINADGELGYFN